MDSASDGDAIAQAAKVIDRIGPARAIFVDAGPLISSFDLGDKHHASNLGTWQRLVAGDFVGFTTDLVFHELANHLDRIRLTAKVPVAFDYVFEARLLQFISVPRRLVEEGTQVLIRAFERQPSLDKRVGHVDCINVAVMRAIGISTIFTNDRKYEAEGLTIIPSVA